MVCSACVNNCDAANNCSGTSPLGTCDTGTAGTIDSVACGDCIECANLDTCSAEYNGCVGSTECIDYDECRIGCIESCDVNVSGSIEPTEQGCFDTCHGV